MKPLRAITALALAGLGSASCMGSCDCGGTPTQSTSVAECVESSGDVRSHTARDVVWEAVEVGRRFAVGDWVRTAEGASAKIRFDAGSEIAMSPASTILIEVPESGEGGLGPMIALQGGVVRGTSPSGSGNRVTLRTPSGEQVVLAARNPKETFDYRVTVRPGGGVEVAVTEGAAEVQSGTTKGTLEPGQARMLEGGRVSTEVLVIPPPPTIRAPETGASLELEPGSKVELSWAPVEGATAYDVEVATDPGFENIVGQTSTTDAKWTFAPEQAGRFHWRVSSRGTNEIRGERGATQTFRLALVQKLRHLLAPEHGSTFGGRRRAPRVEFRWRPLPGATGYEVVVGRGDDLERIALREETSAERLRTRKLARGKYVWGVYAITPDGRRAIFSEPWRFEIVKSRLRLDAPQKLRWE